MSITLVGRSSSHFTRIARIFALELGVEHAFRPVFDLASLDPAIYGDNPALKIPVLVDDEGPLFGTENICRALAARSKKRVVLRGDVRARIVANAEELVLHAMTSEVSLIMAGTNLPPPKVRPSLENALRFLDENIGAVRAVLPERDLAFVEVALFCLVTHLPWRKVMEVTAYPRLSEFAASFGERASARATEYEFDRPT